jgi:hypothetical protein
VPCAKTMITRAHDRFDLHPVRLAADTGYGSAEMLNWLVNEKASSHTFRCSTNPSARTGPSHETTSLTTTSATSMYVPAART